MTERFNNPRSPRPTSGWDSVRTASGFRWFMTSPLTSTEAMLTGNVTPYLDHVEKMSQMLSKLPRAADEYSYTGSLHDEDLMPLNTLSGWLPKSAPGISA